MRLEGLAPQEALQLSLHAGANKVLDDELAKGLTRFSAKGAAGLVLDVNSGEIIALSSIDAAGRKAGASGNGGTPVSMATEMTFEFGSVQKFITLGLALDRGLVHMDSAVNARKPLRLGRHTIHDYRAQNRTLSIPEVVLFSSNVATARMAQSAGDGAYRAFLEIAGIFKAAEVRHLATASPRYPQPWQDIDTLTTSFGHGLAISPIQAAAVVATLVNGGRLLQPSLVRTNAEDTAASARKFLIKPDTSQDIRSLLRLKVERGSAQKANAPGYFVGGLTGSSEKVVNGQYAKDRLVTSFFGVFPIDAPRYLVMTIVDEPQGVAEDRGFKTAAWNAAPSLGASSNRWRLYWAFRRGISIQRATASRMHQALLTEAGSCRNAMDKHVVSSGSRRQSEFERQFKTQTEGL